MNTGLNIGTVVDKESLSSLAEAITRIMQTPGDQETIRHGIDALARMAKIEHVTIQNCVVNGDRSVVVEVDGANGTVETRETGVNS